MTENLIRVGDRVRVTEDTVPDNVGRTGVVTEIDDPASIYPYRVNFDDEEYDWVCAVVRLDAASTASRLTYVEQARKALDGTAPTAADVIRLAEFLATGD